MAAIWNLAQRWLARVEAGETPRAAARAVCRELVSAQQRAAGEAAALILRGGAVIATYSRSATVLAALLAARQHHRRIRVLCSEGRPVCEGRALAAQLARNAIPVEFFTDAALLTSLARADLVLTGCDALFPSSFVNKVGTNSLLWAAKAARIPFYVVADLFKCLPPARQRHFAIREQSAAEVWKTSQKNLRVRNFYFEEVPLGGCTGIVTDQGVLLPEQVRRMMETPLPFC
jgi:translation initiation factor 2B subunit (eIF-2B alpha/beta/delta family)